MPEMALAVIITGMTHPAGGFMNSSSFLTGNGFGNKFSKIRD